MKRILRHVLRPVWRALRWRVIELIHAESGELRSELHTLKERLDALDHRVHVLEREAPVMAQHVSALSMSLLQRPIEQVRDDQGAIIAARSAAIAFYEERISRLERTVGSGIADEG